MTDEVMQHRRTPMFRQEMLVCLVPFDVSFLICCCYFHNQFSFDKCARTLVQDSYILVGIVQ